jgi:uncharacterized protein YycO
MSAGKRHLPLAIGLFLLFASILGILLRIGHPHHQAVAVALAAAGWIFLLAATRRYSASARVSDGAVTLLREKKRRVIGFLALLVLGGALWTIFPVADTMFLKSDRESLAALIDADMARVRELVENLERETNRNEETLRLLKKDFATLQPRERERLLDFWRIFVDHLIALEQIKDRHRHFYQINFMSEPTLNLRSFLTAYSAFTTSCLESMKFLARLEGNRSLDAALNESRPEEGIPGQSLYHLRRGLGSTRTLLLLNAGRANLAFAEQTGLLGSAAEKSLMARAAEAYAAIMKRLGRAPESLVESKIELFGKTTFDLWFPFQKTVAEAMGDLRTTGRAYFITPAQAHAMRSRLAPGDVIIERRNWYLSNIALPGFWPHAALYTGDLEELDRFFAGLDELEGATFSAYLKERLPEVERMYREAQGEYAFSVLEAVSEGILLNAFEESASADYLAVLRPCLSRSEKFKAILRAYGFLGRPYDFDFDFSTDRALVCSEVVYKAYLPGPGSRGLRFALTTSAGRHVVAPNDIIRKFDFEHGTDRADLDHVLFLDGSEETGRAIERGEAELRASWRRPKWDIAQQ